MPDKYCRKCGAMIGPADLFCGNCGSTLSLPAAPSEREPAGMLAAGKVMQASRSRGPAWLTGCAIAAGSFFLLAVGLAVAYGILWTGRSGGRPFVAFEIAPTQTPYPTSEPYLTALPYGTSTPYPPALPYPVTGSLPTPTPEGLDTHGYISPISPPPGFDGQCELTVKNQYPSVDAVVMLVSERTLDIAVSVYVRANDSFTYSGISTGTYDTYVALGQDWDAHTGTFVNGLAYFRFKDPDVLTSCAYSFLSSGSQYVEITLNIGEGSGSDTLDVPVDSFPRLSP